MNPTANHNPSSNPHRILGGIVGVISIAIVLLAIGWGVVALGNSQYHDCLERNDPSYPELAPDVTWPPNTNGASRACAKKNFLPDSLLG